MEIIIPGDTGYFIKNFYCSMCGCIFRAEYGEYKYDVSIASIKEFYCECPTCGKQSQEINKDNFKEATAIILAKKLIDFEHRS